MVQQALIPLKQGLNPESKIKIHINVNKYPKFRSYSFKLFKVGGNIS